MKQKRSVVTMTLGVLVGSLLGIQTAGAGGFGILEQSAEGTGVAYAGSSTGYGDGSSLYFNPAAMSQLEGTVTSAGLHVIAPSAEFNDQGSTVSGFPNIGGNGPDGGEVGLVPNLYAVHQLGDFNVGFGVNAPYGLATEYDRTWAGRYQGVKSELSVLNFQSGVSYNITPNIAVGANLGAYYADAELTNAIDFGSIAFGTLGATTASSLGFAPQANDGFLKVQGSDWAPAWGLGGLITYGPENRNRIGLNFRAKSTLHLHGDQAEFTVPQQAQILTSMGTFTNTGVRASATLPESLTMGVQHWLTDEVVFLYESSWTRWSHFRDLRLRFDNPAQPDSVTQENWHNSWRHSVGARYVPGNKWTFSTGFTYDRTPIQDDNFRTPRIPDADRYWLAGGAGYEINDDLSVNLSYAHLFVPDERSNTVGPTGDILVGEWDSSVDIVSLSIVWTL